MNKGLTGKEIIMKELGLWKVAYPKQKKLLEDFANKIYFELKFRFFEIQLNKIKNNESKDPVRP